MTVTASTRPTRHPGYTKTLPCDVARITETRRLVRTALAAWGMDDMADVGCLIVSELASNAVRHAGGRHMHVTVSRLAPKQVRVAVTDRSRTLPESRAARETDTDGRGLAVVEALSDRWGTDQLPWGKRVWAEWRTDVKPCGQPMESLRNGPPEPP